MNQPRRIFGINNEGQLLVDNGEEGIEKFNLMLLEGGGIRAVEIPKDQGIDQVGGAPRKRTRAEKMRGIDQA